ncbi:MAG: hypothetical protein C5B47_08265, partial [Verrucomicrobia bacterium]
MSQVSNFSNNVLLNSRLSPQIAKQREDELSQEDYQATNHSAESDPKNGAEKDKKDSLIRQRVNRSAEEDSSTHR